MYGLNFMRPKLEGQKYSLCNAKRHSDTLKTKHTRGVNNQRRNATNACKNVKNAL